MRTYARIPTTISPGVKKLVWYTITTDANGFNDGVYFATLCQNLLLNLLESPFYGQNGIPAQQSVIQQVAPDLYVQLIQKQFAPYFVSLTITKVQNTFNPTYNVRVVTHTGAVIGATVQKVIATQTGEIVYTQGDQPIAV
jgi:hypothetical protein